MTPAEAHVLFRSEEALHTFGLSPIRQSGATWLVNDPPQCASPAHASLAFPPLRVADLSFPHQSALPVLTHYYHFGAELIYGMWRTFSSQDTGINVFGDTTHLGIPRRMIFTATGYDHWRDYSGMNGLLVRPPIDSFPLSVLQRRS